MFLVVFVLGMAAGAAGWIWITGGSGEASMSIEDALATSDANDVALAAVVGTAVVDAMNVAATHVADMSATLAAETAEPVEFSIVPSESMSIEDALATSDANDVALAAAVGTAVVDAMNVVVTHVADMSATLAAETAEPVEFSIVPVREHVDRRCPGDQRRQ